MLFRSVPIFWGRFFAWKFIILQKLHSRLQKSTWVLYSKDFLCILFTEITAQRIKVKLWNSYTKDIKGGKEVGEGKLP